MVRKRTSGLLLWLVFLSGGALLVVGLVGLWRSVRDAELRERIEQLAAAEKVAVELRAFLLRPEFLARVPAAQRFALVDGALVVPDDLDWIDAPPRAESPPLAVGAVLADACRLEFGAGDAIAAGARLNDALSKVAVEQRPPLLAAAAWNAHRRGDTAARDAAFVELVPADDIAASMLLLVAAADRPLPDWAASWCARGEPALVGAVIDRLQERDVHDLGPLRDALGAASRRRNDLRAVTRHIAELVSAQQPVLLGAGDRVLTFSPQTHTGAVLDEPTLRGLDYGRFAPTWGEPRPQTSVEVVGPLALHLDPGETGAWSRPWLLSALLLALAACFGLGLHLAFRALRREAAAQRTRAEFLTTVTHELKTPLASLRLLAEMLEQERVSAERRPEYYALLAGESVRLGALIENVLDLGRLERGERSYDRRAQAPAAVVRGAVELFGPLAQRDGLRVEATIADDSARATFDRGALEQALLNVMDNARKYAKDGGLLQITAARENGAYQVRVRDRGPGVAAAERETIFERFVRGARHADGSVPGVGLGMHLSRRILRDHGGDLVCEAPADGGPGACFHLRLPLTETEFSEAGT